MASTDVVEPVVTEALASDEKIASDQEKTPAVASETAQTKDAEKTTESAVANNVTDEAKPAAEIEAPKAAPENAKKHDEAKPPSPTPLEKLFAKLPSIVKDASHTEMWGVELKDADDVPTANVLIKFLRANNLNADAAATQLLKALQFREQFKPLALAEDVEHDKDKYEGLGYVAVYDLPNDAGKEVFTFNLYGAVKHINTTFGNVDEFIKWRVALMELAIKELHLAEATTLIPLTLTSTAKDPLQIIQVHDYKNVSFLRPSPAIRTSSKKTIEVFSMAYPELLKQKYFVNVPAIMGWMFAAVKLFVNKETVRKFHPISNGSNLAKEFSYRDQLPVIYGGKGEDLSKVGVEPKMTAGSAPAPAPDSASAAAVEASDEPKAESAKAELTKTESKEPAAEETKTEATAAKESDTEKPEAKDSEPKATTAESNQA